MNERDPENSGGRHFGSSGKKISFFSKESQNHDSLIFMNSINNSSKTLASKFVVLILTFNKFIIAFKLIIALFCILFCAIE